MLGAVTDKFEWLRKLGPQVVFDCGSNAGQWLGYARGIWPAAKFVCFEPQGEVAALIPLDPLVTVVEAAVGDRIGEVEFRRSSFNQSSSVLPMGALHKEFFPFSAGESVCRVPMTTLDEWSERAGVWCDVLKLDLQGFELAAMVHSPRTMMKVGAVVCETSFVELYSGQPLFGEIHDYMTQLGFRYAGCIEAPLCSPVDGRPIEEDSWWVRV